MKQHKSLAPLFLAVLFLLQTPVLRQGLAAQPVPAGRDVNVIPVVTEFLLGGMVDSKWVDAEIIAGQIKPGHRFQTFNFFGQLDSVKSTDFKYHEEGGSYWDVEFAGSAATNSNLKIGAEVAKMPRQPRLQTGSLQVYEKVVAEYLKANRIDARPEIRQLVRVDLDGDKAEEVIIVASNADASRPLMVQNTYSLVFFRRAVNGKIVTTPLHEHYYHEDIQGMADSPSGYTVPYAADVNGDGCMELFIRGSYYEGFWYEVYEFNKGNLLKVLSAGIGA